MAEVVRIRPESHKILKELAERFDLSIPDVLAKAIDALYRDQLLKGLNDDFAKLKADPKAWAEELAERGAWEATLLDGLQEPDDDQTEKKRSVARRSGTGARTRARRKPARSGD